MTRDGMGRMTICLAGEPVAGWALEQDPATLPQLVELLKEDP